MIELYILCTAVVASLFIYAMYKGGVDYFIDDENEKDKEIIKKYFILEGALLFFLVFSPVTILVCIYLVSRYFIRK